MSVTCINVERNERVVNISNRNSVREVKVRVFVEGNICWEG